MLCDIYLPLESRQVIKRQEMDQGPLIHRRRSKEGQSWIIGREGASSMLAPPLGLESVFRGPG